MANIRAEVEGILSSTEDVIMCLKQSHFSSWTPTFVVITDANVITVHYSFWHYYTGLRLFASTYKTIVPYKCVTGATIRKGNILSTLEIKTKDIKHSEKRGVENSLILDGLQTVEAEKLAKIIDLIQVAYQFPPPIKDPETVTIERAIELCRAEKRKIIWLGFEEKASVAAMLSIPDHMMEAICLSRLLDYPQNEIVKLQNCILMGYTTNSTNITAKVLQLEAQLNCMVINGGLVNNIPKGKTFTRHVVPLSVRYAKLTPLASGRMERPRLHVLRH